MNEATPITREMVLGTVSPPRRNAAEKLLTPDEVAALMDVKMSWLMDHVTRIEPIIPHIRIGKMVRFKRSAIAEWIDSLISTKPTWA